MHFCGRWWVNFGKFISVLQWALVSISISLLWHIGFPHIDCRHRRKRNWRCEKKWGWIGWRGRHSQTASFHLWRALKVEKQLQILWYGHDSFADLGVNSNLLALVIFCATLDRVLSTSHVNSGCIQGSVFISVYFQSHALQNAAKQTAFCARSVQWKTPSSA